MARATLLQKIALLGVLAGSSLAHAAFEYRIPAKGLALGAAATAPRFPALAGDGLSKSGACAAGATGCATWDPARASPTGVISQNGLEFAWADNASRAIALSTKCPTSGKWYWELTVLADPSNPAMPGDPSVAVVSSSYAGAYENTAWMSSVKGITYLRNGKVFLNSSTDVPYGAPFGASSVIGVALNAATGHVWFSNNGVWQQGNPGAGASPLTLSSVQGGVCAVFGYAQYYGGGGRGLANFGQSNFQHVVPAGFNAGLW